MKFIIIENDKIIAEYEGDPATVKLSEGQTVKEIPDNFKGLKNQNINEFDENFNLKSLSVRVKEGYKEIPKGYKLEDEKFTAKTRIEKYIDGDEALPKGFKIVKDKLEEKTIQEKLKDKETTEKEILDVFIRPQRNQLLNECDTVYCNALNLKSMSDSKIKKWEEYKQALKDFPKKVDFKKLDIKNIEWPTKPK